MQDKHPSRLCPQPGLSEQRRLADPRLALEQQRDARPFARTLERRVDPIKLSRALEQSYCRDDRHARVKSRVNPVANTAVRDRTWPHAARALPHVAPQLEPAQLDDHHYEEVSHVPSHFD